jgi:hypothetical protein
MMSRRRRRRHALVRYKQLHQHHESNEPCGQLAPEAKNRLEQNGE